MSVRGVQPKEFCRPSDKETSSEADMTAGFHYDCSELAQLLLANCFDASSITLFIPL